MCVTNILFYFLTAYKFVSAPSVEKEAGNTSRLHFYCLRQIVFFDRVVVGVTNC